MWVLTNNKKEKKNFWIVQQYFRKWSNYTSCKMCHILSENSFWQIDRTSVTLTFSERPRKRKKMHAWTHGKILEWLTMKKDVLRINITQ